MGTTQVCYMLFWANPTKDQLYGHQPPISQTIQDEHDMQGTAEDVGPPARTCIHQFYNVKIC